jgi:hypothetical protein
MRIVCQNIIDDAELTCSPEAVSTLPITNLQTIYREQVARWTEIDAQVITALWTSSRPVSCVVLYRTNFGPSATWRVRLYSDSALTAVVYDSGVVAASAPVEFGSLLWGVDELGMTLYSDWDFGVCSMWFTTALAQGMVIDLVDSDNTFGYGQASRLFAGAYFESTAGPRWGQTMTWEENTQQTRTEGGSLRTEPGASWRTLQVSMAQMPEDERRQLAELARQVGMRGDVFISLYPGQGDEQERDHQMQAKLTSAAPIAASAPLLFDQSLSFGEI